MKYKKIIFSFAAILLFLCVIEAGLRLTGFSFTEYTKNNSNKPDPIFKLDRNVFNKHDIDLIWSFVPNSELIYNRNLVMRVNSKGLRGKEYGYGKAAGIIRILLLGDSSIFGWGIAEDLIFGRLLEEMLNNAGLGRKFEVINGGNPGYSTEQSLRLYKKELHKYSPDIIIAGNKFSDCFCNFYRDRKVIQKNKRFYAVKKVLSCSVIYQYLRKIVWSVTDGRRPAETVKKYHRVPVGEYAENLKALSDTAKQSGARIIFLSLDYYGMPGISFTLPPEAAAFVSEISGETADLRGKAAQLASLYYKYDNTRILEEMVKLSRRLNDEAGAEALEQKLMSKNRWFYEIDDYDKAMKAAATQNGWPLADIRALGVGLPARQSLFIDEVHPSAEGHRLVAGELFRLIRQMYGAGGR